MTLQAYLIISDVNFTAAPSTALPACGSSLQLTINFVLTSNNIIPVDISFLRIFVSEMTYVVGNTTTTLSPQLAQLYSLDQILQQGDRATGTIKSEPFCCNGNFNIAQYFTATFYIIGPGDTVYSNTWSNASYNDCPIVGPSNCYYLQNCNGQLADNANTPGSENTEPVPWGYD